MHPNHFGQSGAEYVQAIGNALRATGGHGSVSAPVQSPQPSETSGSSHQKPPPITNYKYLIVSLIVVAGFGLLWLKLS